MYMYTNKKSLDIEELYSKKYINSKLRKQCKYSKTMFYLASFLQLRLIVAV